MCRQAYASVLGAYCAKCGNPVTPVEGLEVEVVAISRWEHEPEMTRMIAFVLLERLKHLRA